MPRGIPNKPKTATRAPAEDAESLLEVEPRPKRAAAVDDAPPKRFQKATDEGVKGRPDPRDQQGQGGESDVPPFTVAWVQPILNQAIAIPGRKVSVGTRIDPLSPDWQGWRIVVAGASVLLIAPAGWEAGIVSASGDFADEFAPVAEAHGWEKAEDVRQVFEVPRSHLLIRYYVDVRGGNLRDAAFASAIRKQAIAAPDDATRAAWARMKAEEEARENEERLAAERARARQLRAAPKPTAAKPTSRRPASFDTDDEVGYGDEGPEVEDDEV